MNTRFFAFYLNFIYVPGRLYVCSFLLCRFRLCKAAGLPKYCIVYAYSGFIIQIRFVKTYFPHHFCLFTNNKKKIKRRLKLIKPNGQCHEASKRKYNVFCKMYRHIIYAAR